MKKEMIHYDPLLKIYQKDIYLHPTDDVAFKRYQMHHNESSNAAYFDYHKKIFDQFVSIYLKEGNTLDFGCGEYPVYKSWINDLAVYDLYFFNDTDVLMKQYDNIILLEVIEHFKDPIESFKSLCHYLKPNGRLIIQTQFVPKNVDILDWWYIRDITHLSFYSLESFQYIASFLGMKILYSDDKSQIVLEKKP